MKRKKKILKYSNNINKQDYLIADEVFRASGFNSLSLGFCVLKQEGEETDREPQSSISSNYLWFSEFKKMLMVQWVPDSTLPQLQMPSW